MRTICRAFTAVTLLAATACSGAKAPAADSDASAVAAPAAAAPIDTAKADTLKALPDTNERVAKPASKPVAPPAAARDSFRKPKFQVDEKTGKVEPIRKP